MEKYGEIRDDLTEAEEPAPGQKQASEPDLASHTTQRTAAAAAERLRQQSPPAK